MGGRVNICDSRLFLAAPELAYDCKLFLLLS